MPPLPETDAMPMTRLTMGQWLPLPPAPHWAQPHVSSWREQSMPPSLPGLVYTKLGDAAWQRFYDFSRWPDAWAGESSRSIAWGTYLNFERFLDSARFLTSQPPPSLFLTDEGHLELAWDAPDGSNISVALTPTGAEYFVERRGETGMVTAEGINALADRLCRMD